MAFKLYDTGGFGRPRWRGGAEHEVDLAGFDEAMDAHCEGALQQAATSLGQKIRERKSCILRYEQLSNKANVLAVFNGDGDSVGCRRDKPQRSTAGTTALCRERRSGRTVLLRNDTARFQVTDTQPRRSILTCQLLSGTISPGDTLHAEVDEASRTKTRANHSATHLLHAALRQVLGDHVQQKGSLVNADKLRFDFAHTGVVEAVQLEQIENLVNQQVRLNTGVETQLLSYDEALESGATALFGEKYGDQVRVLSMGEGFSMELCGGTHVDRTGDIGLFRIASEAGIAAGIRRIEAMTGDAALQTVRDDQETLEDIARTLKVSRRELGNRLQQLVSENRNLARQVEQLGQQLAANKSSDLGSQVKDIHGVHFLAAQVEGDNKSMMQTLDTVRSQLPGDGVVVLAVVDNGKVALVAAVSKGLAERISAAELMQAIAPLVGAKAEVVRILRVLVAAIAQKQSLTHWRLPATGRRPSCPRDAPFFPTRVESRYTVGFWLK